MAYLVGKDEAGAAFRIDLPESGDAILGRSPDRANVLIEAGSVSGRHCSITQADGAWTIKDLDSTNGTCVNGENISEMPIYRGDTLSLGQCMLVIEGEDVPERDETNATLAPTNADDDTLVEYIQSSPMNIEPRSSRSPTVKVLPTQFQKKATHMRKWVVLISVFVVLAIFLTVLFVQTLL